MQRINVYLRVTKYCAIILSLIMIYLYIAPWFPTLTGNLIGFTPPQYILRAINSIWYIKQAAFVINAISCTLFLLCVSTVIKILNCYIAGEYFSRNVISLYSKATRFLLAWTIYNPVEYTLLTLLTSLQNSPGQRILGIQLSFNDLWHILIVGFFAIITHLMQYAYRLKQDQDLVI